MEPAVNQEFERLMSLNPRYKNGRGSAVGHGISALVCLVVVVVDLIFVISKRAYPALLLFAAYYGYHTYLNIKRLLATRSGKGRFEHLVATGVHVEAYLIQANSALFQPGNQSVPCLVLFSFQEPVAHNESIMEDIARRTFALKETHPSNPDLATVAHFTTDERAYLDRRRLYPLPFTNGHLVYCADLWIDRVFLPNRCLTSRKLQCLATPGNTGSIELLPPSAAALISRTVGAVPDFGPPPQAPLPLPE